MYAIGGGGGGGYDITLDKFWLLSYKEVAGLNFINIDEGSHMAYFRDVANTSEKRIQYDDGGVAREVWLRSADVRDTSHELHIKTDGMVYTTAYSTNRLSFLPAMCI